jgi:hypothetical protein
MTIVPDNIEAQLLSSFAQAERRDAPYPHWLLRNCLPTAIIDQILDLPWSAPDLGGVSGRRELHNDTRTYFDAPNRDRFPCVAAVARALQSPRVTSAITSTFGAKLAGTYLRIEFAQDRDGFWLEPHTDIGVKMFTYLLYLSKDKSHASLGTDIYAPDKSWVGRSPFASNSGMIFVPSDISYHGFEKRPIEGVRKSLVINYVTKEWRAREQLAFPDQPV